MLKNIVRVLVTSGVLAGLISPTQTLQAAGRGEGLDFRQEWIVGSWSGTLDNGEQVLMSCTLDGIAISSVQGEVKSTAPVLTTAHGVWAYVGGRQFALTRKAVLYDLQTGQYQGSGKIRELLTLDRSGDRLSGNAKVDVFAPDGTLLVSFSHTIVLTRIKVERLD